MQLCGVEGGAAAEELLVVELWQDKINKKFTDMEDAAVDMLGQPSFPNELLVYRYPSREAGPSCGGEPVVVSPHVRPPALPTLACWPAASAHSSTSKAAAVIAHR